MHVHIVGICGTFMGGVAAIAQELGFKVTGSDENMYPPMSTQLESMGINLSHGFSTDNLEPDPDIVVIGNALSRGNPEVEAVLNRRLKYTSGAQWLADNVLTDKWVLAVSGTHGKTTTAAMLAWILDQADIPCGFLIGGVVPGFGTSARLGTVPFFVVEADEYDTAFFDKHSKFVHYRPRTLLINNMEFDHADIFDSLDDIKKQFHYLVRTVPSEGLIIYPEGNADIQSVLRGWTPTETIGGNWHYKPLCKDGSTFEVLLDGKSLGTINWNLLGKHNIDNALGAIACARNAGVPVSHAIAALHEFEAPKRRLELLGEVNNIRIFDDFAHHPSAIKTTLEGLKSSVVDGRVLAVLEPRSNTMKRGTHKDILAESLYDADGVFVYKPKGLEWSLENAMQSIEGKTTISDSVAGLIEEILAEVKPYDNILIMSNDAFDGIYERLLTRLETHICD